MAFTLETNDGQQARAFQFDGAQVTIGRDRSSDFTLDHPTVSRQHAIVQWDGAAYKLVILSRGGLTAIDGQQVAGEVQLFDGAQLMFGQLQFIFRSAHAGNRPAMSQAGAVFGDEAGIAPASIAGMHMSNSGIYQAQGQMPSSGATMQVAVMKRPGSTAFPTLAEHEKLAKQRVDSSDGLVSWDEIAADADNAVEKKDALTNFMEMQKAQEAADAQRRGVSPTMMIVFILVVGGTGLVLFYGGPKIAVGGGSVEEVVDPIELTEPVITWRKGDREVDCAGAGPCRQAAIEAFEVGNVMLERREADIVNLWESFKHFDRAEELLAKAAIDKPPQEMRALETRKAEVSEAMKSFFVMQRANFLARQDRKDYKGMKEALTIIQAYNPDDRLNHHRWAEREILAMKVEGVLPED